jgi:hypothetical protein
MLSSSVLFIIVIRTRTKEHARKFDFFTKILPEQKCNIFQGMSQFILSEHKRVSSVATVL